MVKVKAICRDSNDYTRKTNTEIEKVYRNTNPKLHPFQKAREYIRAYNAVKLDKVFSKPFLFALNQPTDCVKSMAKNPKNLTDFVSGGFDGQIIVWNLPEKKPLFNIKSPHNMIKGLSYSDNGNDILAVGDDNKISIYSKPSLYEQKENFGLEKMTSILDNSPDSFPREYQPASVYTTDGFLESIDHSYKEKIFVTGGQVVSLWNYERNTPIQIYKTSPDGYLKVKFNYSDQNIFFATGFDRTICIFDIRTQNPTKSISLRNKSACGCWNPQEPMNFTVGNEDSNCYTFDFRNFDKVLMIHKDHINSVLDLDYASTGKEFVTGSFDQTIRIFRTTEGYSRECYHTKRMQKVYSVLYTADSRYVLSGSDDTNIRIWKATANDPIKILTKRESEHREYSSRLIEKYKYMPNIRKILNHKHLPKYVINKRNELKIRKESKLRKFHNKELNSKPGTLEYKPERVDKIVKSGIVDK